MVSGKEEEKKREAVEVREGDGGNLWESKRESKRRRRRRRKGDWKERRIDV